MSTKVPQNKEDQEIDLLQIPQKISDFFGSVSTSIFKGIQFFVRNKVLVLALILVGFGMGWYLETNKKAYNSEIIVIPNFDSVDYLYAKIDLLQSKIVSEDTIFFKDVVGIKEPKNLTFIKIKSITDVYNFIKNKPENYELIKLLAEDGDVNKVIEDNKTSKNYKYQKIIVTTNKKADEEKIIKPLMAYLNESNYYKKMQKVVYNNTNLKIRQNDSIIKQIDAILSNFSNASKYSNKSDKLMYNNENSQINDLLKTKDFLLLEQGTKKIELIGYDKIIKESSVTLNVELAKFKDYSLKFSLPIFFIFLFIFLKGFNSFYKKQINKIAKPN